MIDRLVRSAGVLALLAMVAPSLRAAEEGWSFEIAMGEASFDVSRADLDPLPGLYLAQLNLDVGTLDSTLKRKDRSYALTTSYRFNPNLAMETTYFRLGAFQYAASGIVDAGTSLVPVTFNFNYRAKGATLGVALYWPLGGVFEVRGRGGISTSDTRVRRIITVSGSNVEEEATASSQDFYLGGGIGATLHENYRFGIDWVRHFGIGSKNYTYSTDADNLLLSIAYLY